MEIPPQVEERPALRVSRGSAINWTPGQIDAMSRVTDDDIERAYNVAESGTFMAAILAAEEIPDESGI